ncbi:MAG: DUF3830 family protein [Chloroflexi bacterium]|nr:DUF3830 family protein [Chloroflexota bacterium]
MARRIALALDGTTATAVLHEDAAPNSAQKMWDALPIEATLRHLRWGGNAAYVIAASLRDPAFPKEHRVSLYAPGTLNYQPEYGEISIAYGESQARDATGNAWATPLATFEGDARAFLDAVARTQHEGRKQLVITRREG